MSRRKRVKLELLENMNHCVPEGHVTMALHYWHCHETNKRTRKTRRMGRKRCPSFVNHIDEHHSECPGQAQLHLFKISLRWIGCSIHLFKISLRWIGCSIHTSRPNRSEPRTHQAFIKMIYRQRFRNGTSTSGRTSE